MAKEQPVAMIGLYACLYMDRLEAEAGHKAEGVAVECSGNLPASNDKWRRKWRVLRIEPGVEAELLDGSSDNRSARVTVTRLALTGIFAFGLKKKKGHAGTQLLFISNDKGDAMAIPVGPKHVAKAKIMEAAINQAVASLGPS